MTASVPIRVKASRWAQLPLNGMNELVIAFTNYTHAYSRESTNQRINITIELKKSDIQKHFPSQTRVPYTDSPARKWLAKQVFDQVLYKIAQRHLDPEMEIGSGVKVNELGLAADDYEHDPTTDINWVRFEEKEIKIPETFLEERSNWRKNQRKAIWKRNKTLQTELITPPTRPDEASFYTTQEEIEFYDLLNPSFDPYNLLQ